jgi:phage shock protein PspC (stress-responsive transcriptional regulator)
MTLADELAKLEALRQAGALSEDEFARAKARLLDAPEPPPAVAALSRLRRSAGDRWIAGVCGGLARATGVESWLWRLIFVVLLMFGGTGVIAYVLLWIFVPQE